MRETAAVIGTAFSSCSCPAWWPGVPWWDFALEFRCRFLGAELTRFVGSALILAGVSGSWIIRAFRAAGARHASADRPDPTPRRYRPLSLCAQSNLRGGRRRHFRQAVLFGDWRLFAYGAASASSATCLSWATRRPTLKKSFGAEYEAFRINVPVGSRA